MPINYDATNDEPDSYTAEEEREACWDSRWREGFALVEQFYPLLDCPDRPTKVEPEDLSALNAKLASLLDSYKMLLGQP